RAIVLCVTQKPMVESVTVARWNALGFFFSASNANAQSRRVLVVARRDVFFASRQITQHHPFLRDAKRCPFCIMRKELEEWIRLRLGYGSFQYPEFWASRLWRLWHGMFCAATKAPKK